MFKKITPGNLVKYRSAAPKRKNDVGLVLQIVKGDQSPFPDGEEAAYILWPNHFKQHCMLHTVKLHC